jgi:hypothetical protein
VGVELSQQVDGDRASQYDLSIARRDLLTGISARIFFRRQQLSVKYHIFLVLCRAFAYYDTEAGVLDSVDDDILDAKHMRRTKIVATIGPTSNTQEAIIEMGDKGVNVCRMNMSHGDHTSHQEVVEKIKYYNSLDRGCLAILLDTKVRL